MSQLTFAEAEYQNKKRKTRREIFLEKMDAIIPWKRLENRAAKHYPKGEMGRPPYPLSVMLRVHCLQLFYNLSDPALEDSLYEIESMRRFAGLRLSDNIPDETTILNFRHFLEKHGLGKLFLKEINKHLQHQGLLFREGTIVDASIISAPSSTKNQSRKRDPEMHSSKKGNQWHFGMKMHIGVDDVTGMIHSVESTAANVHDVTMTASLLHGEEKRVFGDAGYLGFEKRRENKERKNLAWLISARISKRKTMTENEQEIEKMKAKLRAKVEHPFRYIKCVFGYNKVRYKGLDKNHNRLCLLAGLTNLMIGRKHLLA